MRKNSTTVRSGSTFVALLGSAAMLNAPIVALAAGNANVEIQTAAQHADYASRANEIDQVHLHLHHVVNCLEGSGGKDFDATAGNPCKGEGDGALDDLGTTAQQRATVEQALNLAKLGTEETSFEPAHNEAGTVYKLLRQPEKTAE
jgi:hypothetical protein